MRKKATSTVTSEGVKLFGLLIVSGVFSVSDIQR